MYLQITFRSKPDGVDLHNATLTPDELLAHMQQYAKEDVEWILDGFTSAEEAERLTLTERGLGHLEDPDRKIVREVLHAFQRSHGSDGAWG
jgi:hypothetical protein